MTMPILVCAFPGMGKTYLAQHLEHPFTALDLDFGHYRTHYLHDERTWNELRQTSVRISDVPDRNPFKWWTVRRANPSVFDYYTSLFNDFLYQVMMMDLDVVLINTFEALDVVRQAASELWVIAPASYDRWHDTMDVRRKRMIETGCSLAKISRHDRFVKSISEETIHEWHQRGLRADVTRRYVCDDARVWQHELIDHLRHRSGAPAGCELSHL